MMQRVLLKQFKSPALKFGGVGKRAFASGTSFDKFDFEDPFKLDALLTDEERAISDAAR